MENWQYFKTKPKPLLSRYERWREITKLLKLSHRARLRLEWIIYCQTKAKGNASLTCRYFGIARKTFYKWLKRFDEMNLGALDNQIKRPNLVRRPDYTRGEVIRVEALRARYPTAGREKLTVFYQEEYGEPVKPWSMRRIIHDRGLYAQRATRSRRQKAQLRVLKHKRITELAKKPIAGFLVEIDTIVICFANEHRYILTAIDHYSRLSLAYMYKSKTAKNAADFLRRLLLLFGQIDNLHLDNGSEFKGEFEQAARELGIELYHARPYRAQDKPIIERFNGIIQQEYIDLGHFTLDVERFNQNLVEWLVYYNFKRPHHSLGLKRPIDYANMQREKVLPMWSPMTGA